MLKHLTAIAFLAASTHAMAQTDMTLDGLAKKEPAAFSQMVKGHTLPAWIKSGGTGWLPARRSGSRAPRSTRSSTGPGWRGSARPPSSSSATSRRPACSEVVTRPTPLTPQ